MEAARVRASQPAALRRDAKCDTRTHTRIRANISPLKLCSVSAHSCARARFLLYTSSLLLPGEQRNSHEKL